MFIPPESINLKTVTTKRIFLGLQGEPGTGKTTGALTAPNPVVLDFDGGLQGKHGEDVIVIPINQHDWVTRDGKYKPLRAGAQANRRDCALDWLSSPSALKLEGDQTLIIDSWTTLQYAFDVQTALTPKVTKSGQEDPYDFWDQKLNYARTFIAALKALKCHVIVIHHESKIRDPVTGDLKDKVQPLMQGRFAQELKLAYPDYYRCVCESIKGKGSDNKETELGRRYFWQIKSNQVFDAKCTLKNIPEKVDRVDPDFKKVFSIV